MTASHKEQNTMEEKRQLSPEIEKEKRLRRFFDLQRERFRIIVMSASPDTDKEQKTMALEEIERQLSPEMTEERQLSPENEERRRLYQDRFFDLERRYRDFVDRINSIKLLVLEKRKTLDIVRKEKRVIAIDWKEASSLCNELKADFLPFFPDLRKCLDCNMKDCSLFLSIFKQDNHQSEEGYLMLKEILDLNTKTMLLNHNEMGAECFVERLSWLITTLEDAYNKLLVKISSLHTPESEEDAGAHLREAKDSRARSPPDSPEWLNPEC